MQNRNAQQPQTSANRMNQLQLREQQQLNRERRREEEFQQEQQNQLIARQRSKYEHVSSHGYGPGGAHVVGNPSSGRGGGGGGDDVEIKVTVRSCDNDGHTYAFYESEALHALGQQQQQQKGGGGGAARRPSGTNSASSNHAQQNGGGAGQVLFGRRAGQTPPSSASAQQPQAQGHAFGAVPKYLVDRKAQMKAEKDAIDEELARQKVESQYPPGHRPVGEDERQAILSTLAQRKKELEMELGKLPMRFDTQALKQKRQQIESEMAEVEAAQQKFSVKKQLYVPI